MRIICTSSQCKNLQYDPEDLHKYVLYINDIRDSDKTICSFIHNIPDKEKYLTYQKINHDKINLDMSPYLDKYDVIKILDSNSIEVYFKVEKDCIVIPKITAGNYNIHFLEKPKHKSGWSLF